MHSPLYVLLVGLSLGSAASLHALDFQVHALEVEADGIKHTQSFLRNDEASRVLLDLPAGWDHAAEPGALTLTSRTETDTMVRLEKSPFAPDTPFKDKALDAYRKRVLAAVPQGATETQVSGEHEEPLPIFSWKSHEFVVDYVFFGRAFRRSMVFLNLNAREQILVTTVAPQAGYDRAHGAAFDVLRSWQVVAGH